MNYIYFSLFFSEVMVSLKILFVHIKMVTSLHSHGCVYSFAFAFAFYPFEFRRKIQKAKIYLFFPFSLAQMSCHVILSIPHKNFKTDGTVYEFVYVHSLQGFFSVLSRFSSQKKKKQNKGKKEQKMKMIWHVNLISRFALEIEGCMAKWGEQNTEKKKQKISVLPISCIFMRMRWYFHKTASRIMHDQWQTEFWSWHLTSQKKLWVKKIHTEHEKHNAIQIEQLNDSNEQVTSEKEKWTKKVFLRKKTASFCFDHCHWDFFIPTLVSMNK